MSGDRSGGRGPVPGSPLAGARDWLLASPLRLQLLVAAVVLAGAVTIVAGTLVLFGDVPSRQGPQADAVPTPGAPSTPVATPTSTPTPPPTPPPTPADAAGAYRAATVVASTTGDVVTVRFDDGRTRRLPLAAVDVPEANGDDPAAFDGVLTGAAGRTCLGDYGERATIDLADRLVGANVGVRVVADDTVVGGVGLRVRNDGRIVNRDTGPSRVRPRDGGPVRRRGRRCPRG
ncbi:MAG: hypothetical protein ABEH78_07860 [Haloferacaceae archaeon]